LTTLAREYLAISLYRYAYWLAGNKADAEDW
jgi:DNA-directed RNA polymerase specialized sigma24 family protein